MKIRAKIKNEMLHSNLYGLFASVVTISNYIYLSQINKNYEKLHFKTFCISF